MRIAPVREKTRFAMKYGRQRTYGDTIPAESRRAHAPHMRKIPEFRMEPGIFASEDARYQRITHGRPWKGRPVQAELSNGGPSGASVGEVSASREGITHGRP